MSIINNQKNCPIVLQTAFRIFFLGAAGYTVVSMIFWFIFYVAGGNIFVAMPLTVWHAHEMIFGFAMAVIAGFLLTAVMNWTGQPTLSGRSLLILFLFWALARIFAFMPASFSLWPMICFDTAFLIFLIFAVMRPIIAVKQWKQSAIFSKLILILFSQIVFYWALLNGELVTERKALKFAVYMIVSLILTISRRVLPFFIERGVGYPVTIQNNQFNDIASLVLIIGLSIIDVFLNFPIVTAVLSALLVIVHALRLAGWHTPGIWKKPLLWVLFVGYLFIIMGFLLKIFSAMNHRFDDAALHAFTAGGIGIFTLGMMARVSWGHTGRNIGEPLPVLPVMFFVMFISAVVRVFFTLCGDSAQGLWIGISQILWMSAFVLYLFNYFRVLTSPRPDGKWG